MAALRVGILTAAELTLEEVTPLRDRLDALGAQVTLLIPARASIMPVSGRYFPAAGGLGARRALDAVAPGEIDMLILPDGLSGERLQHYAPVLALVRQAHALPVFTVGHLLRLLDAGAGLDGLMACEEAALR